METSQRAASGGAFFAEVHDSAGTRDVNVGWLVLDDVHAQASARVAGEPNLFVDHGLPDRRPRMSVNSAGALSGLVKRVATASSVADVVLVGSQARGIAEPGSDFDIFVYADDDLPEFRIQLAEVFGDPAAWRSVRERALGDGDVWRLRDAGGWLDLMNAYELPPSGAVVRSLAAPPSGHARRAE